MELYNLSSTVAVGEVGAGDFIPPDIKFHHPDNTCTELIGQLFHEFESCLWSLARDFEDKRSFYRSLSLYCDVLTNYVPIYLRIN